MSLEADLAARYRAARQRLGAPDRPKEARGAAGPLAQKPDSGMAARARHRPAAAEPAAATQPGGRFASPRGRTLAPARSGASRTDRPRTGGTALRSPVPVSDSGPPIRAIVAMVGRRLAQPALDSAVQQEVRVIQTVTAEAFGVSVAEILGVGRTLAIVPARFAAVRLARELTGLSFTQLARRFNRDRTTLLHAFRAAGDYAARDSGFATRLDLLRGDIAARLDRGRRVDAAATVPGDGS